MCKVHFLYHTIRYSTAVLRLSLNTGPKPQLLLHHKLFQEVDITTERVLNALPFKPSNVCFVKILIEK